MSRPCVWMCVFWCRVIDVGSEWRTFNNEKDSKDNSRVGAAEVCLVILRTCT